MNTAIPRIAASRRSNPKDLDKVRTEFDRLTRRRLGALLFGAVALRGTRSLSPLQRDFSCVIPSSATVGLVLASDFLAPAASCKVQNAGFPKYLGNAYPHTRFNAGAAAASAPPLCTPYRQPPLHSHMCSAARCMLTSIRGIQPPRKSR